MKPRKSVVASIATLCQSAVNKKWHKSKASFLVAKKHSGLAFQMQLRKVHGFGKTDRIPISQIGIEVSQTIGEAMNTALPLKQNMDGTILIAITRQRLSVNILMNFEGRIRT